MRSVREWAGPTSVTPGTSLHSPAGSSPGRPGGPSNAPTGISAICHIYAGRLERTLEIVEPLAEGEGVTRIYGLMGLVATLEAAGRAPDAMSIAEEAVARARVHANPFWMTFSLWAFGSAFAEADPKRALAAWRKGLGCAREHRIMYFEGFITRDAAMLSVVDEGPLGRLELFDTAVELFHEAGNVVQMIITLGAVCAFFERTGRPESAAILYGAVRHQPGIDVLVPSLSEVAQRLRLALGDSTFERLTAEHAGSGLSEAARHARKQIQVTASQLHTSSDQAADEACP